MSGRRSPGWRLLALGVAAIGLASAATAGRQDRFEKALADVEKMVADAPGEQALVVAVTDRKALRLVVAHGYADIKARRPATRDTLFAIGSISKSFTAIALMQMADEGRYDPDAPIARYLPDFHPRSDFSPITGRALMSHSAGLPNYRSDLASMRYLILALNAFHPSYAPGAHFWYSNSGYQLLGYAAEQIDGRPFPVLLQHRILDRLAMTSTFPQLDERLRGIMATSYVQSAADGRYVEAPWFDYLAADGAIVSTGADMAAYARMLLNGGSSPSGPLLSSRAFARFTTPVVDDYAFGINVKRHGTILEHSGGIAGFNALLEVHSEDGFGLAVLSNAKLDRRLLDRIVARLSIQSRAEQSELEGKGANSGAGAPPVEAFAGTFVDNRGKQLAFGAARNGLILSENGVESALVRVERAAFGQFVSAQGPRAFSFFTDPATGAVIGVSDGWNSYLRKGSDKPLSPHPTEWVGLVGRYKAHGEEGPDVRCLIWDGRLYVVPVGAGGTPEEIVKTTSGAYRFVSPDYAPETFNFSDPVDGKMQRLNYSGEDLYRIDLP